MSSKSRSNGRPALALSTLAPLDLDLPATGNPWLVCVDCLTWVEVIKNMAQAHKDRTGARCPGSAQLLDFDLTHTQHASRRITARAAIQYRERRTARIAAAVAESTTPRTRERIAAAAEPTAAGTRARRSRGAAQVRQRCLEIEQSAMATRPRTAIAATCDRAWEQIGQPDRSANRARREFTRTEQDWANAAPIPQRRGLIELTAAGPC